MNESVTATLPLRRWQGDRGTYHLVSFTGEPAEALTMHAALHRLEFGRARGFGSIKVTARIGETRWKTSVFPQKGNLSSGGEAEEPQKSWVLLVSKKVMKAEGIGHEDEIVVQVVPV